MGAGSTRRTTARHENDQQPKGKPCMHFKIFDTEVGNCHFANTGKPYHCEKCTECKASFLVLD